MARPFDRADNVHHRPCRSHRLGGDRRFRLAALTCVRTSSNRFWSPLLLSGTFVMVMEMVAQALDSYSRLLQQPRARIFEQFGITGVDPRPVAQRDRRCTDNQ